MPLVTTKGLKSSASAASAIPNIQWAVGTGTADVITAAFSPQVTTIADGIALGVRLSATNATTTPSFNPDGTGPHTIVKQFNEALEPGDLPAEAIFRYNSANSVWVLENPATQWREITEWAVAGGAADAITATYTPAHGSLKDGQLFGIRAISANATTAPTLAVDTFIAYIIYKYGKVALAPGDINGANHEILVRYHSDATPWFELLNPQFPVDTTYGVLSRYLAADDVQGADSGSAQPWFPTTPHVAVKAQAYEFWGTLYLSRSGGANAHTTGVLWTLGSATISQIDYIAEANANDDATLAAMDALFINTSTVQIVKSSSTSTTEQTVIRVKGVVVFSSAGTCAPGFQYNTAPGNGTTGKPTPKKGSYFILRPLTGNPAGTWT